MRYSNTILHYTSFGEKEGIWREFLRFGEYISLDKFIYNTTSRPAVPLLQRILQQL